MSATAPLPPGPRLHPVLQTAGFMLVGPRFLEACRRRYGDAVTFSTVFDERFVMVFEPELVKEVFQGSAEQLHAGEANALLGPMLGERSVLLLDGERAPAPPAADAAGRSTAGPMQSYAQVIRDCDRSGDRQLAGGRAVRAAGERCSR